MIQKTGYKPIHIVLGSNGFTNSEVEIFNALDSFAWVKDVNVQDPANPLTPYDTLINTAPLTVQPLEGSVIFDQYGQLHWSDAVGGLYSLASTWYNYRSTLEALKGVKLDVHFVRITGNSDQILEPFKIFNRSIFGEYFQQIIDPLDSFSPENIQANIIDVPLNLVVDGFTGLKYKLKFGKTVSFDFFSKII